MKIEMYNMMANRRRVMQGIAATAALAVNGGMSGAFAQANNRAAILAIPGVGKGQPTDADWQKVGAMCLEPTKANVKEGEFKGVERL